MVNKNLELDYSYKTARLSIDNYRLLKILSYNLLEEIIKILTPNVTKSLPDGWQNITTSSSANNWINERSEESVILLVESKTSSSILGFVFLYPIFLENNQMNLRFGYLLAETHWGKGIGTELINGLVKKCQALENVKSISGGVEKDNMGSIKVLEKCGFHSLSQEEKKGNVIFYEKTITG